ncbi:hypothetical protein [Planctellipticum variicoloris]|uniref:hypothetical protein n=1 Tax=Planctellipticum variicoloris TaxID=3064265 RepID=UPI003013CC03
MKHFRHDGGGQVTQIAGILPLDHSQVFSDFRARGAESPERRLALVRFFLRDFPRPLPPGSLPPPSVAFTVAQARGVGDFVADAAFLVALFNMLGRPLLLVGVFRLVAARHDVGLPGSFHSDCVNADFCHPFARPRRLMSSPFGATEPRRSKAICACGVSRAVEFSRTGIGFRLFGRLIIRRESLTARR